MIDTYFDRADASTGYKVVLSAPISSDTRYFRGQLYATNIDRSVAEARFNVHSIIAQRTTREKIAVSNGFSLARLPRFER